MKKRQLYCFRFLAILYILLSGIGSSYAQISEGGLPPSYTYPNSVKSALAVVEVPVRFSVEDLKAVDAWQASQGAPLRIAKLIDVAISLDKEGETRTLPDGQSITQLRIRANNAVALMLYYSQFYIPEGGKLFLYNADKTQLLGAYTQATNPTGQPFATEFIAGDELTLEYVSPARSDEQPRICIESIGYGYNQLYVAPVQASLRSTINSCMVNINCEEGDDWQKEKDGVCKMVMRIGKSSYLCSASLVNNTKEDLTPYLLSAFHCTESNEGNAANKEEYNQWLFYFGYERTQCSDESIAYKPNTMTGCSKVVAIPIEGGSDGLLLKLNQSIPARYHVYYNGWDRSDTPALSGTSIHHPNGEYKKISTFFSPARTMTWAGDGKNGSRNGHWNVLFDATTNGHGVTAGGSSGSPLFNQDKQVVGTLTGGNSECNTNESGTNLYGKLAYHWDKFPGSDSTRMDRWLDPIGKGVTRLAGRYATDPSATDLVVAYPVGITPLLFDQQIGIRNNRDVTFVEIISIDGKTVKQIKSPGEIVPTGFLTPGVYLFKLHTAERIYTVRAVKQ